MSRKSREAFEVMALSPASWSDPGIAVAAARAGGVGLLDLEFCHDIALAESNFRRLLASSSGQVGLLASVDQLPWMDRLLLLVGERRVTLVLNRLEDRNLERVGPLRRQGQHRLLIEVSTASDVEKLSLMSDGIVAKGHEAPGWVGEDSTSILLQKLLKRTDLPIYIRGGVGINAAAGCRAVGAAGVVLDDQVLLMDDSVLPAAAKQELSRLVGAETRLLGEQIDAPCRVYARPNASVLKLAEADTRAAESGNIDLADWRRTVDSRLGWAEGDLMPLGQGIGIGAIYQNRYKRVGKLVQALRKITFDQIRVAAELGHLGEGSALARSQDTRYPLAQGPMTRVSDNPAFAAAVAHNGALPFLALALMRGEEVLEMLQATSQRAGDRAWGVGLLGFIPQALRDEQCEAIWKCRPPYALIAGGRPDQAAAFEQRGIKTYIHAPAPALLKLYLEQGARRFVFEGRECGGHIGPIGSFPLWEQMVEVLLAYFKPGTGLDVHLMFAGGVSDGPSAAMLAALTAPLAARGMKIGALMGTAYLFTHEIVESGAIVQGFQDQAVACTRTVNLETGPGHSTRCADTQFAHDFFDARRALMREKRSPDEIRDQLEDLNIGRLRIASKGRERDADGKLVEVDAQKQLSQGMYMIGQVATLTQASVSIAELHEAVCFESLGILRNFVEDVKAKADLAKPSDIAIIGIGALLPKAEDGQTYWDNVLQQVSGITEIPESRWDWRLYFDPDKEARDKVYSKWGGFLDEVMFDPTRYGIPPKSMKSIDPLQLLTLEAVSRALDDAALGDFDRENTSVILGASGGAGELGVQYGVRSELRRFAADLDPGVFDRLPEWTTESFAGILLNVASGRVANRMDFGGLNFTVDAACASSLAALSMAVNELESGRSNVAIAGGVDTVQSPYGFMSFSKTQALSAQGKPRAFDKKADGIVISEGLTMVVLKRLADAEASGDRIYAVIKSVAGSSDGKAMGMTAPRPDGQLRALDRAYRKAGFTPDTLGMIEAHGTGTAVGDKAEAETVSRALIAHGAAPRSVAIGSVKSLMGHTKACAGMAGLVKLALALHHRVLPGHATVDDPLDVLADPSSPAYLLKTPRPWLRDPAGLPRRGGVSAFGFGGTNFHAVVEEYRDDLRADIPGSRNWTFELIVFRAPDAPTLRADIGKLLDALRTGQAVNLGRLAFGLSLEADRRRGAATSLAFAARSVPAMVADLQLVERHLAGEARPLPLHLKLALQRPVTPPPLAFVFPGQGAQYINMGSEAALFIEELRIGVESADRALAGHLPERLSRRMWPEAAYSPEAEAEQLARLTDTRYAQPAIGALELGYLALARRLGLQAVATAGHSYGEFAALHAAGVIDRASLLRLSAVRGQVMAQAATSGTAGTMAAVQAPRERVAALIRGCPGVRIANHNTPEQSVISGPTTGIVEALALFSAEGVRASQLPVSGAFHTELMSLAQEPLSQAIAATAFAPPELSMYSNGTGGRYPEGEPAMRALLGEHLLSSVEFVKQAQTMYADGVRVFLELGPKSICSNMIAATLSGVDARSISLDGQGGGLRGLLSGLSELLASGIEFDVSRLFESRGIQPLDVARLGEINKGSPIPTTAWYLTGGYARPLADSRPMTGIAPALTQASAEVLKQQIVQSMVDAHPRSAAPLAEVLSPPQPAPSPLPAAVTAPSGDALAAYHETMRQFLALQERVITQFLGGTTATTARPDSPPAPYPAPTVAPPAIELPPPRSISSPAATAIPTLVQALAPAPAIASPEMATRLLAIVAERTGYPPELLSLDADLEADLGIDSIKRVEIIGALRKVQTSSVADAMQRDMERLTRAKSLGMIIQTMQAFIAAIPGTLIPNHPAAPARPVGHDPGATLLQIVAERTGYPAEMLTLDADLEADLGIDSIKRVEIIGAFRKAQSPEIAEAMQRHMEGLTRAKSLAMIIEVMTVLTPSRSQGAAPAMTMPTVSRPPDVGATLLEIVAQRTGYPTEMLTMDADLEADLGIDSIKRVEIIGALRKSQPAVVADAMQREMERLTRAKSLGAIVSLMNAVAPPDRPIADAALDTALMVPPSIDYRAALISIVAERTGYPAEILTLDADLEADLGIDSIKRVEIIGALQKQLPATVAAGVQSAMERFTRAKTMALMLDRLSVLTDGPTATAVAAPRMTASTAPSASGSAIGVPRYVIRARPAPLSDQRVALLGSVVVAGGPSDVVDPLLLRLRMAGAQVHWVEAPDGPSIRAAVDLARRAGPIVGLVHLHGLSEEQPKSLPDWRALGDKTVLSLFRLVQALAPELPTIRLIAATRLGGTFGRDAVGPGTPIAGGVVGLLNCVREEFPQATLRAVDFNGQSSDTLAAHLLDELTAVDRAPEAGHTGDARFGAATLEQDLIDTAFAPRLEPAADWVVLATGGARGITAELLEEMARPGLRMVLVGRTPEPRAEDPSLASAVDTATLKRVLLSQARARSETPKPVDIDRAMARVMTDREIRANLLRLRTTGAQVEYQSCDVRDPGSFGAVIDGLYARFGRIDAVLHGAGVIEDRRIEDKTEESFARVFGTKLDSSFILIQNLRPDTLKLLVFFTSVAGRYGNRGQIDYAAANEAVNRLAWTLSRRWTETRVVAANWGPWDAGMASDAVKQQLRERGMVPIPVTDGRRYFLREMALGSKHEVEIVIGRGPWGDRPSGAASPSPLSENSTYPLVRAPLRLGPGGALVLTHCLTLQSDPYLAAESTLLPGQLRMSAAAEWIGQTVGQGWPGWQVAELVDLRQFGDAALEAGRGREIEVRARATSHSSPGEQIVVVEILDAVRRTSLFKASVRLVEQFAEPSIGVPVPLLGSAAPSSWPNSGVSGWQMAIRVDSPEGLDAELHPPVPADSMSSTQAWQFEPSLVDAAAALADRWSLGHRRMSAPTRCFGRLIRVPKPPRPSGPLSLRLRVHVGTAEEDMVYDAMFFDPSGRLRLALLNAQCHTGTHGELTGTGSA